MNEDGSNEEALESVRRVYDRQVSILGDIDDVSMRTFRTDILVLGFVAAALTAGGPDAASSLHWLPVVFGSAGSLMLLSSAFVCVGIYNLTEFPNEVQRADIRVAHELSDETWTASSLERMSEIVPETIEEVQQNGEYLALAHLLLLLGTCTLAYATLLAILSNSYGVHPICSVIATVILALAASALAKHFMDRE